MCAASRIQAIAAQIVEIIFIAYGIVVNKAGPVTTIDTVMFVAYKPAVICWWRISAEHIRSCFIEQFVIA